MIAIGISKAGGPEVLRPVEMPVPAPGDGEVLIKVASAGVNRPDLMQREGKYPLHQAPAISRASKWRAP
jgi:NADPH2:quinone reductase